MARWHLSIDLFRRFLDGRATKAESKQIVRHLLTGCDECVTLSSQVVADSGYWFPRLAFLTGAGYEGALTKPYRFRSDNERRATVARVRGWGQWAALERLLPEERLEAVMSGKQYHHWGFYRALLDAFQRYVRSDPREATEIVALALAVADLFPSAAVGGEKAAIDLRASASAVLGNARRLAGDLKGARQAINDAWRMLEEGTGDPVERAHLLCLDASYIRTVGEFETAESVLREALEIYVEAGDTHLQGRTLLQMGDAIGYIDPERGIEHIRHGLGLVNTAREPRLELCAQHDLAFLLTNAGRAEEALAVFDRARPLYQQFPDEWTQLRYSWMEGKIARGLGHLEEAADIFRQVWANFQERQLDYDLLMVSLDLAECFVAMGQHGTAARFASEVYGIMSTWQVDHYALAAWLVLQNALELREAGDLVSRIRIYYLRHWHRPAEFTGE